MQASSPLSQLSGAVHYYAEADTVSSLLSLFDTFCAVLSTSYGPAACQKALFDDVGDMMLTADGLSIVKHMDWKHPVAQILIQSAARQQSTYGDGSTTLLLLVAHTTRLCLLEKTAAVMSAIEWARFLRDDLSAAWTFVLNEVRGAQVAIGDSEESKRAVIRSLMRSVLDTKLTLQGLWDTSFLKSIVDALPTLYPAGKIPGSQISIADSVQIVASSNPNSFPCEVSCNSCLLTRRPSIVPFTLSQGRVVMFRCPLDQSSFVIEKGLASLMQATLVLSSVEDASSIADKVYDMIVLFANSLVSLGVSLVVVRGHVDSPVLDILQRLRIAVISQVSLKEMSMCSRMLQCEIAASLHDFSGAPEKFVSPSVNACSWFSDKDSWTRISISDSNVRTVCVTLGGLHGSIAGEASRTMRSVFRTVSASLAAGHFLPSGGVSLLLHLSRRLLHHCASSRACRLLAQVFESLAMWQIANAGWSPQTVIASFPHESWESFGFDFETGTWTHSAVISQSSDALLHALKSSSDMCHHLLRIHGIVAWTGSADAQSTTQQRSKLKRK